jgi:hypothetical protein
MTDHIITSSKNGKFKCEFCGAEEAPPFMPAPIDTIIDAMDVFIDTHKNCKRPQAETVMSEYIVGFNAGYSYVIHEIERYVSAYKGDKFPIAELLHHLANVEDGKTRAD